MDEAEIPGINLSPGIRREAPAAWFGQVHVPADRTAQVPFDGHA